MISAIFNFFGVLIKGTIIVVICSNILFIAYKGNQPMNVPQAPKGMTYFEFMGDRIDAAKTVKPAQCGWGMFLTLATFMPIYSVVYTEAGIHPDGYIAHVTAHDPDIPKGVIDAEWDKIPDIWWNTVEKLSWTMLGKPVKGGCKFRQVSRNK